MCALDCGTITFMSEKIQFLNVLLDKRPSFELKRCGFESHSGSFFLHSFNLLVFILDLCTHGYIYLNLTNVYSSNTHVET